MKRLATRSPWWNQGAHFLSVWSPRYCSSLDGYESIYQHEVMKRIIARNLALDLT